MQQFYAQGLDSFSAAFRGVDAVRQEQLVLVYMFCSSLGVR